MSGARLGPYEILQQIGAGGMGMVFRARDTRLGREVAIKVLPPAFAQDAEHLSRFEQEARAAGSLNHPNILSVHDVGTFEGGAYLVTELLEGETLRDRLRGRTLPPTEAAALGLALARGLAAAHDKGIVHRDLKPENIFMTREGWVKILDFGLAKGFTPVPEADDSEAATGSMTLGPHLTQPGMVVGTLGYMSPEQIRGARVDGRSDLFALGAVLYEVLHGRNPFRRNNPPETMAAVLKEEPDYPVLTGDATRGLSAILGRCLAKDPDLRFKSAQDLASALESWGQPTGYQGPPAVAAELSIVVLPFENLSPDPDDAFFADGLTEEVIGDLARIKALRVISRKSAMHYKGSTLQLPEIAQALKVRFVLEGSVRRSGTQLRITAQLVEAARDATLWAERFNGTFADVFEIQEQVSRAIVAALQVQLSSGEDLRLARRAIDHPAAYESYLRAYQEIMQWDPAALDRAERHLDNARALVGEHAVVLAGYAALQFQRVNLGLAQEDTMRRARAFAEQALVLDPALPQGHSALAMVCMLEGDYPRGVRHFQRAREEAPGDVAAWGWLPWCLCCMGRDDLALPLMDEILRSDPVEPNWHFLKAVVAAFRGDFQEAAALSAKALAMTPPLPFYLHFHARVLDMCGRTQEALQVVDAFPPLVAGDLWLGLGHMLRAALRGDAAGFDALMSEEVLGHLRRDGNYSFHMASMTSALGRTEEAVDWLENAVDRTFAPADLFLKEPRLKVLASHPRFERILARARKVAASVTEEAWATHSAACLARSGSGMRVPS